MEGVAKVEVAGSSPVVRSSEEPVQRPRRQFRPAGPLTFCGADPVFVSTPVGAGVTQGQARPGSLGSMIVTEEPGFPVGHADERELYLDWLRYLRESVMRKVAGLSEAQARWRPDGGLLPLLGIVNHLTHVEWRWIDGGFRNADVHRSGDEFCPGPDLSVATAIGAYQRRGRETDDFVRVTSLDTACARGPQLDLRWVLLHLINETARHAGHADATRELLDGLVGE